MRGRVLIVLLVLAAAACGREGAPVASPPPTLYDEPTSEPTAEPTDEPTPSASPTATPTGSPGAAAGCRNSTSPACGGFRFDPDVEDDEPIEVRVSVSPPNPKVGDEVVFSLSASDPDSPILYLGTHRFTRGGTSVVVSDDLKDCPKAYGPWDPPKKNDGATNKGLRHTYRTAGEHEALFTFYSHSYRAAEHPWPNRPPGDGDGGCIDPLNSSGKVEVTVTVRGS